MAIGRITGPLLASNLLRDGVNLAFETDLLYLDVTNNRIGIKRSDPLYELDIFGTARSSRIIATTGTIGLIVISTNTISTVSGPIDIAPYNNDDINLRSNATVFGSLHVTKDVSLDGSIQLGSDVSQDKIILNASIESDIVPKVDNTYKIGNASSSWAEGYFNELYTKIIASSTGTNITINPSAGLLEVNGNLRVNGTSPIGTFPVVTNILYVTMDGDDTNDGRGMDPSRACRTIGGALKSPSYGPGTQIRVAPGHYLEDNPLLLDPYTSVVGSDLRTCSIEPINKTQDLFHVQSGCYIAQLQMTNGRSGILPIQNALGYNRGAYCTAFPPSVNGSKIDVYHSPYIQNCTNQSGPWLKDGTMFVPNQTVQVPAAIGTGTWIANTSSIVVYISSGTVVTNMSINQGPQNLGFFDARTLLLANKKFLQEQVIEYINSQTSINASNTSSIWYDFSYNQQKCFRDVGILVENISYDTTFGGNEKSVESGKAYYNGVISLIAGQEPQTTEAINYLSSLTQSIITNTTITGITVVTEPQVINFVLDEGAIAGPSLSANFDIVTSIINSGTSVAPTIYKSSGPDNYIVSAEILLQSNRSFIQHDVVEFVNNTYSTLVYDQDKCLRDSVLIVDSIVQDLLFSTSSQSTFAGLQYYTQGSTVIPGEETTTTNTFAYVRDLSMEIVQNIIDGTRYSTGTQITTLPAATTSEAETIKNSIDLIINIINTGTTGITDLIVPNKLEPSININVKQAYDLLLANKSYIQDEAIAYITANHSGFVYDSAKCRRDVGYIIDSIAFDLLYGGNKQSIQSGVAYFGFNSGSSSIPGETTATISAYNFIKNIIPYVVRGIPVPSTYQSAETQILNMNTATLTEATLLNLNLDKIINIINSGTVVADPLTPIRLEMSTSTAVVNAAKIVSANRNFIAAETVEFVNANYAFSYNEDKCFRDAGLIVDAVTYDLILGGNTKSIEAGLGYYIGNKSVIQTQTTQTVAAINHARDISLQIIANSAVTPQPNNTSTQIINTYFSGGSSAAEAITRNYNIITSIIEQGPSAAPENYIGSGLFASTGINTNDVKEATKITSVTGLGGNQYRLGLDKPTIGAASNATIYIGNTNVFPLTDDKVPDEWALRRVDPLGAMGGSLVDGAVVSERSPINSFVYDAFTQVTQGGRGIHITNNGYAQLVSVFTIFCSNAVLVENGGIASITNSNANFGDLCLVAKGYGRREFSGTVYNPPFPSDLPNNIGQFYPNGYWPQDAQVKIFVPDTSYRPHIGLVMEVEPPNDYVNAQGFPGFLSASPAMSMLTTGSISITGIDTTGISIGNSVYIRDQFGSQVGSNGKLYADTGTIVTDIGFQTVFLNQALTSGGGEADNPNFFNIYFSGNAYYNVLSSTTSTSLTPFGQSVIEGQVSTETSALVFLNTITNQVISNITIIPQTGTTVSQIFNTSLNDGSGAASFITERFNTVTNIIVNGVDTYPDNPPTTGTIVSGAGTAIRLIEDNLEFLTEQTVLWVNFNNPGFTYDQEKCARDVRLILRQIIYDLESGGYYYSTYAGLAYWSRVGTHHIVSLEDQVRDPELFPDGAIVNFYQRSYMSALGYTFEYVGAGITYGALPQVGRADPVQSKEVVMLNNGKVFFTSTDQNGDFRIGPGLTISQATGVLSGRTFTRSLFATMTPFILAVESS